MTTLSGYFVIKTCLIRPDVRTHRVLKPPSYKVYPSDNYVYIRLTFQRPLFATPGFLERRTQWFLTDETVIDPDTRPEIGACQAACVTQDVG
jgi:hypothetical protein